jgi:ribosomal protein L40E
LVLVLAALNLLVLLLAVAQLSKIRSALVERPAQARSSEPVTAEPAAAEAAPQPTAAPAETGKALTPGPTRQAEPAPGPALGAQSAGGYAPQPASLSAEEPASIYGATAEPAAAAQEAVLVAHETVQAQSAAEEPIQAEPAAQHTVPADEPQEQPFERDGRWWFRRGDELLVYEESTGQWVPAPVQRAPAPTQTLAPAEMHTASSWRCPHCNALNGATATSCRMCFSPRPA